MDSVTSTAQQDHAIKPPSTSEGGTTPLEPQSLSTLAAPTGTNTDTISTNATNQQPTATATSTNTTTGQQNAAGTQPAARKRKQNRNRRDRRQKLNGSNATVQTLNVLLERIVETCAADEKHELIRNIRPLVDAAANLAKSLASSGYAVSSRKGTDGNLKSVKTGVSNGLNATSPTTTEQTAPTTRTSPAKLTDYDLSVFSRPSGMTHSQSTHHQHSHPLHNLPLIPGSQIPPYVYKPLMPNAPLIDSRQMLHQQIHQQQRLMMMNSFDNGSNSTNNRRVREMNSMMAKLVNRNKKPVSKQHHDAMAKERAEADVRTRLRQAKEESDYKTVLGNAEELGMAHEMEIIKMRLNKLTDSSSTN